MSEEEVNVLSVQRIRAQMEEKLTINGFGKANSSTTPLSIDTQKNEEEESPPVPPHSPKLPPVPPANMKPSLSDKICRPPLPLHRVEAIKRASNVAPRPQIAPKPSELRKSPPTIVIESTPDPEGNFEGSVRARAQELEKLGLVFRNSNSSNITEQTECSDRPVSIISSTSNHSEMSDSESDDESRPPQILKSIEIESSTSKIGVRRPSALCFNGDPNMHDRIMDELKKQGIVSHQGFYKKAKATENPRTGRTRENNNVESPIVQKDDGEIPTEIGRMRENKKIRQTEITLSMASTSTSQSDDSRDRNSCMTIASHEEMRHQEVKEYDTGDPLEDKRLKNLHYAANEFYTVQKSFCAYLKDMEQVYPNYVAAYGRRLDKDLLSPPWGYQVHPVKELQSYLGHMVKFHETLLVDFTHLYASWDSRDSTLATKILKSSDFLKMCIPFLKAKSRLAEDLARLREENRDFDNATVAFEQKIFNRGVGAVVQQLDQVHQNFMRYKILMISYQNYLKPESEEYRISSEAIAKLETITQKVNQEMGLPSNEQLSRLYDRFQTHFDVFVPGRRLIREGDAMKQTRKEMQTRHLVLFSDFFWICRVSSLSSGLFDITRSYSIPIESITIDPFDHEDFEHQLKIKSKVKSCVLVFRNTNEARVWEKDLRQMIEERKLYKRRVSEVPQKNSVTALAPQTTLLNKPINDSEPSPLIEDDLTLTVASDQSIDSLSQPCTPVEETVPEITEVTAQPPTKRKTPKSKTLRMDPDNKPLWIPDETVWRSSKCLMEGCGSVFGLLNRRHHCRNCGWLICSKCAGKGPVSKYKFHKMMVCPECYEEIYLSYKEGDLFPTRLLVRGSDNEWRVKLMKEKSHQYELAEPRSLFTPPVNRHLKRMDFDSRLTTHEDTLFNEVHVRLKDGTEIPRFAQLEDGVTLRFYKFRFDTEPCEQHLIHGFEVNEIVLDEGGTLFELIHRNQFPSDRKERVIAFRVQNQKSIQKWSTALHSALDPKES